MSDAARPAVDVGFRAVLAFFAELAMLTGLALVGWSLGPVTVASLALAVVLPGAVAVVWGRWCAPRATRRLSTPPRWALKITLFSLTFLLLLGFGPRPGAAWFGLGMWLAFLVSLPADRGR